MGFQQLLLYALPLFLLSMWLEHKLSEQSGNKRYTRQDFVTNVIIGVGDVVLALSISAAVTAMLYLCYTAFERFRISLLGYRTMGWGILTWAVAILLDDLTYYWFHRTSHRIRILWACHIVHHNSDYFNLSTAIRNSWVAVFYKPFYWTWLAVLGFHPLMILTCMSLSACYQFFCHTELLPGWDRLSFVLTTPGLHAIHHGKDDQCIDKNYAGVFIFIDRFFGTFQPIDRSKKVTFGVTHPPKSQHYIDVNIHEFQHLFTSIQSAGSFSDKIKCLIKGPEWKPGTKRPSRAESMDGRHERMGARL